MADKGKRIIDIVAEPTQEAKMDKTEAVKVLVAEREARVRACNAAVSAVLQEHRCRLVPQVVIRDQQVMASIAVVAEE